MITPLARFAVRDRTWWLPTWLDEKLPLLDTEGNVSPRDATHLPAGSA